MEENRVLIKILGIMIIAIIFAVSCQQDLGGGYGGDDGLIAPEFVSSPVFNPPGGEFDTAQSVAISVSTSDAVIRYTTDGTDPTELDGNIYSGPVGINSDTTLKALGYKTGYNASSVSSANYTILQPDIQLFAQVDTTMDEYQNNEEVDYGYVRSDTSFQKDVTFRISNPAGGGVLYLSGGPDYVALTQSESYYSFLGDQPASPIQPGTYEEFVIRFDADTNVANKDARIAIASNDPDEPSFVLDLTCYASS